jgi:hypothetical protein
LDDALTSYLSYWKGGRSRINEDETSSLNGSESHDSLVSLYLMTKAPTQAGQGLGEWRLGGDDGQLSQPFNSIVDAERALLFSYSDLISVRQFYFQHDHSASVCPG